MIRRASGEQPGTGHMAGIAFRRSGNMGSGLAAGSNAIVATGTGADGLRVIHRSRR